MTDWGGCIIQVRKRNKIEEGWQRNFLAAILSCSQGMRLAIAVSPDVDIRSMDDIMWCLTTRVNPHTDIINPLPGGIGQTFQPQERMTAGEKEWTASNTRFEGGMGIDATVPFGYEQDFHIESFPPGHLAQRGLGFDELRRDNPRLIAVSITPYGQQRPARDYPASDIEIMAASGAMSLAGEAGGEPMRVTEPQAAMGALTALAHRTRTGVGQRVDVSAQAAVVAALAHAPVFWDLNGLNPERAGMYITGRSVTGARMRAFWPCRDGWINFIIYGGVAGRHTNQQLVAWMDERGMAPDTLKQIDWGALSVPTLTQREVDALEEPIARFLATLTKREFLEGAAARKMLGYPVSTAADIHNEPQLAARHFWQDVGDTRGTARFPGGFAIVDGERLPIRRPAPAIGEHNEEVYGHLRSANCEA